MDKKPLFIIFLSLVSGMFVLNILKFHPIIGGILLSFLLILSVLLILKGNHRLFLTFLIPFLFSSVIFFINERKLDMFLDNSEVALTGRVISIKDNSVLLDRTRIYLGNKDWKKLNIRVKVIVMDYSNQNHKFFSIGSWMFTKGILRRTSQYPFLVIYTSAKNYSFAPYRDSLSTMFSYKIGRLRKGFEEFLKKNSQYWDLITAIIFGKSPKPTNKKLFMDAGLYHLFVVSGLHVNLLMTLIYLMTGFLIADSRIRTFLTIALLLFYGLTVGYSFPAMRAIIMMCAVLFFKAFDYPQDKFNILGFAGILIFLMDPMGVFSVSLQLSFVSTFIFISIFLEKQFSFFNSLKATLFATLCLIPFTILYFGKIYPLSVVLSSLFVLTTIIPMVLSSTMGFLMFTIKLGFLAKIFIFGLEPFVNFMELLTNLVSKIPLTQLAVSEDWRVILFYILFPLTAILSLSSKEFNFFKHSEHIP